MALGSGYLIGLSSKSGASSNVITPTVATTAGDAIFVCCDSDENPFSGQVSSVTDSQGNTYTRMVQGNYPGGTGNPWMAIYAAFNTTALATTDTITVTWVGGNSDINATALGCPGVQAGGTVLDQQKQGFTTSGNISLQTGPLALNSELAILFASSRQAQGAPAITSDWTSVAAFQGAANTHYDQVAWKTVSTADPISAAVTTPSAGTGWGVLLATFRASITPTMTMASGGSLTLAPVIPVAATMTMASGGSMAMTTSGTPAALQPLPPPAEPVFPAGYGPVTADMQAWAAQVLGYCANGIIFRAEQTTGQSLTGGTYAPLRYDSVLEDPFSGWSPTATSGQAAWSWLAPWTGVFRVTVGWTTTGVAGTCDTAVGVTGVNPTQENGGSPSPAGLPGGNSASFDVSLIGGADYLQLLARCSANATTDAAGGVGLRPYVEITATETDLQ